MLGFLVFLRSIFSNFSFLLLSKLHYVDTNCLRQGWPKELESSIFWATTRRFNRLSYGHTSRVFKTWGDRGVSSPLVIWFTAKPPRLLGPTAMLFSCVWWWSSIVFLFLTTKNWLARVDSNHHPWSNSPLFYRWNTCQFSFKFLEARLGSDPSPYRLTDGRNYQLAHEPWCSRSSASHQVARLRANYCCCPPLSFSSSNLKKESPTLWAGLSWGLVNLTIKPGTPS